MVNKQEDKQRLSSLFDDELQYAPFDEYGKAMQYLLEHQSAYESWQAYSIIRSTLRGELSHSVSHDFVHQIHRALSEYVDASSVSSEIIMEKKASLAYSEKIKKIV